MLTGQSQDWPLSREEKKERLLRLYDKDLKETEGLLQMSARRTSEGPYFTARAANEDMENLENMGDSFNASPVQLPGAIGGDSPTKSHSCKGSPLAELQSNCNGSPLEGISCKGSPVEAASCERSPIEDVQSSHGGRSVRSFEYLTPESTPRTPPGYQSSLVPPCTFHMDRPISAPAGQPNSAAGRDFSVCKHTGTVIPSIPQMPPSSLRNDAAAAPASAGRSCLTPPPSQSPEVITHLPKRPHSAAAISAFSASRSSSSRRRSDASACHPPFVFSAARHGRYAEVEDALLAGFVPNFQDMHGNTVFHIACQNGKRRIAKLAVKFGCDMNAQNMRGHTGLHFLFAYGYPDVAEYFIKKGANDSIKNGLGKTAREGIK